MARYIKSGCKLSRKIGLDLNLKGIIGRDIKTKCKLGVFPGQHGSKRKNTNGHYSSQLIAKQMLKFTYGMLEKQFKRFYRMSMKHKGSSGEFLLKLLESRLDNVVYRMGFSLTRAEARQLISHKSVILKRDGIIKTINISSFLVKKDDIITLKEKSKNQTRVLYALKCAEKHGFVDWVKIDLKKISGVFLRLPERSELSSDLKEQMVIEFYSR